MAEMVHKEYLNKVNILDSEALGNLVTLEENYHDAASSLREQINATEFLDTEIPREKVEVLHLLIPLLHLMEHRIRLMSQNHKMDLLCYGINKEVHLIYMK